jgi:hypothetical protein
VFLLYWKKSKSETGIKLIVAYSCTIFLLNFSLLNWEKVPILYDSYTLIEFLLFSSFLHSQLKSKRSKTILIFSSCLFTLFYFGFIIYTKVALDKSYLTSETIKIDSIPVGIEGIFILSFSFFYLYECTRDTTTLFIYNTYQFWVVLGIVLYLAGTFFIYIFTDSLKAADVNKYWVVINVFSILRTLFFVIAIIYNSKPQRNNTLNSDFELTYLN